MFNRVYSYLFSPVDNSAQNIDAQRLLAAAKSGNLPGMSTLMNDFPRLDVRDERGNTPLILAASENQIAASRMLINYGAEIDIRGENGFTALHVAAYFGHVDTVALLISHGANIENRLNPDPGKVGAAGTPLWSAVRNGHENMVKLLIAAGADVDAKDGDQNPLLVYAVSLGNLQIVALLRQAGADASLFATNGHTAYSLAEASGRQDLMQLLRSDRPGRSGSDLMSNPVVHMNPRVVVAPPHPVEPVLPAQQAKLLAPREQRGGEVQQLLKRQRDDLEAEPAPAAVPAQQGQNPGLDEELRARRLQYFAKNGMFAAGVKAEMVRTNNPQKVSHTR
jgi:ankyrin repeat protein